MSFLSSFFPKFWRGQIVPLAVFLRDNFNCSVGLAQWRGLAQTLIIIIITIIITVDITFDQDILIWIIIFQFV